MNRDRTRAEIVCRVVDDAWVVLRMNGGCNVIVDSNYEAHDNRVKAVLETSQGLLEFSLTEDHFPERAKKFVDVRAVFRKEGEEFHVRVDNQCGRALHHHIMGDGVGKEDHVPSTATGAPPLKLAVMEATRLFKERFPHFKGDQASFQVPPIGMVTAMLSFDPPPQPGVVPLPITFLAYPDSEFSMGAYTRKGMQLALRPVGFVLEKRPDEA